MSCMNAIPYNQDYAILSLAYQLLLKGKH